ncbi:hypothetical protein [Fodinibius sp. AD559]|uniref:hypothetical protein n=1 Tax=Fodinibius sp. AD559 TaxID=3424179 RepID=UPI004046E31C
MNLGLTTSFIIAGILLLSILSMNRNISQSSQELTMRQVTQMHTGTVSQILEKDIPNIGYQQNGTISSPITDADSDFIQFKSDIDNDGSVETIEWKFTDTDVNSSNPNDKVLIRRVDGKESKFKTGITKFEITYLNKDRSEISPSLLSNLLGGAQTERDKIRFIEINFTVESKEKIGRPGNADYTKSTWEKQYTPQNLRL